VFIFRRIKKDETRGFKCHAKTLMIRKTDKTVKETPTSVERGGQKTREWVKSGV
jgi:hypothetical protein